MTKMPDSGLKERSISELNPEAILRGPSGSDTRIACQDAIPASSPMPEASPNGLGSSSLAP
jgi:hypothetical protein